MLYTSLKKLEILLNNHNYNYTIKGNLIFNNRLVVFSFFIKEVWGKALKESPPGAALSKIKVGSPAFAK